MKRLGIVLWLFAQWTMAQQIQILDKETLEPVVSAHYTYGEQKGTSDAQGMISLTFTNETKLSLTHVMYGLQTFSSSEVKTALDEEQLMLTPTHITLQPATVIARTPDVPGTASLKVSGSDMMAHDAGEFLAQDVSVAGIRKSGAYGFDPVLRGFKYDRINVVYDQGLSATAACPNRMDPPTSQVPMNMVSRVEILKGPHALRYGTGFGGTLHFKSNPVRFTDQLSPYGRISAGYETNGEIYRSEALAGASGKFYNLGIFGSYSAGSNYTDGNGNEVEANFNRRSIGGNLAFKLGDTQQLKLSVTNNYAHDVDFPALNMDLRKDDTWLASASHQVTFQGKSLSEWNTSVYGSYVDHAMDNFSKVINPRTVDAETLATTQNFGGRTEAKFNTTQGILYGGLDFRMEQAEGTRTREILTGMNQGKVFEDNIWQNSQVAKSGAFAEYQLMFDQYYLVASARLEMNQGKIGDLATRYTQANNETEVNQFNPSVSLGISRDISESLRLGLWLGRAQRSAGLTERFINYLPVDRDPYERVGNINLKPEANNELDASLAYSSEKTQLTGNLFASILTQYITSVIDTSLTPLMMTAPGVKQYQNTGNAILTGFEVNWNQQWALHLYSDLSAAYTYGTYLEDNTALPEIAPMDIRLAVGGKYFDNKLVPEISVRQVLEQNRISEAFGETVTPAFTLVNAKVSYQIHPNFSVLVAADNLFDIAYYEHLSRSVKGTNPGPIYARGRNIRFAIMARL